MFLTISVCDIFSKLSSFVIPFHVNTTKPLRKHWWEDQVTKKLRLGKASGSLAPGWSRARVLS